MLGCRRDVPAVHISTYFRIQCRLDAVSAAIDLSLDNMWSGQLPARYLQVADHHKARVDSQSTTVWPHLYLRTGSCRAPCRRTRGWSRTVGPHVSLARLCPPRQTVQGQVQAHQPYPSPYGRTTFPVSVSRLRQSVRTERESQDPQTNAHWSVETHSYIHTTVTIMVVLPVSNLETIYYQENIHIRANRLSIWILSVLCHRITFFRFKCA